MASNYKLFQMCLAAKNLKDIRKYCKLIFYGQRDGDDVD